MATITSRRQMTELEQRILGVIAEATLAHGHIASWHISEAVPGSGDLDMAMRRLIRAGLVEEVPDLGCRYRLRGVSPVAGAQLVLWLKDEVST